MVKVTLFDLTHRTQLHIEAPSITYDVITGQIDACDMPSADDVTNADLDDAEEEARWLWRRGYSDN